MAQRQDEVFPFTPETCDKLRIGPYRTGHSFETSYGKAESYCRWCGTWREPLLQAVWEATHEGA